jgi:hypothetical protein
VLGVPTASAGGKERDFSLVRIRTTVPTLRCDADYRLCRSAKVWSRSFESACIDGRRKACGPVWRQRLNQYSVVSRSEARAAVSHDERSLYEEVVMRLGAFSMWAPALSPKSQNGALGGGSSGVQLTRIGTAPRSQSFWFGGLDPDNSGEKMN